MKITQHAKIRLLERYSISLTADLVKSIRKGLNSRDAVKGRIGLDGRMYCRVQDNDTFYHFILDRPNNTIVTFLDPANGSFYLMNALY